MDQVPGSNLVNVGIDLSEFYLSVEWDILDVPARRNEEYYPCCTEPYSGKTFKFVCWYRHLIMVDYDSPHVFFC
jgi:nicotinic acetylcholine receptor